MTRSQARSHENSGEELDLLVVGAGFAGLYQLYRFVAGQQDSRTIRRTGSSLLEHPQVRTRELVREVGQADGSSFPTIASPYVFSRTPIQVKRIPRVGEHNREILGTYLKLGDAEIADLDAKGILHQVPAG